MKVVWITTLSTLFKDFIETFKTLRECYQLTQWYQMVSMVSIDTYNKNYDSEDLNERDEKSFRVEWEWSSKTIMVWNK